MRDYDTTDIGVISITTYQVHNIFLQIAAEMGIIGLAVFIWLISMVYGEGVSYIKSSQGFMTAVSIGMLGGITAFLVHGLVDAASLGNHLFLIFWFLAGLVVAIRKMEPETKPSFRQLF